MTKRKKPEVPAPKKYRLPTKQGKFAYLDKDVFKVLTTMQVTKWAK